MGPCGVTASTLVCKPEDLGSSPGRWQVFTSYFGLGWHGWVSLHQLSGCPWLCEFCENLGACGKELYAVLTGTEGVGPCGVTGSTLVCKPEDLGSSPRRWQVFTYPITWSAEGITPARLFLDWSKSSSDRIQDIFRVDQSDMHFTWQLKLFLSL